MKNAILNFKLITMALGALLVFSCSAEDGEDGAAGPQGPQGEQGPAGQDGADGEDGNANVIASEWITSEFPSESFNTFSFPVSDTRFTTEIINSAAVLAYGRQGSFVVNLPDSFEGEIYNFSLGPETIFFEGFSATDDPVVFDRFDAFRYVIIPAQDGNKKRLSNFSKMTYEEVMDYLGLDY